MAAVIGKKTVFAAALLAAVQSMMAMPALADTVSVGQVNAEGTPSGTSQTSHTPSDAEVQTSGEAKQVTRKKELQAATGATGGAAQAMAYTPGAEVTGYGASGATKYSISLDGIKQGWGGPSGGSIDDGSLSITFDGVPMVNPGTGLWQGPEVNQMSLIQSMVTTYGPGDPLHRWYNNIGGQIDFVPIQPTEKAGGDIGTSYGTDHTRDTYFDLRTGSHDGYSAVFAGGVGGGDSFRNAPDGFQSPNNDYAYFAKLRKVFDNGGHISFGGYVAKGEGYRPNVIPVSPIPGVTTNGFTSGGVSIPGPLYSEQTTGFYSALPYNEWNKIDSNKATLAYTRLVLPMDSVTTFHNLVWYQDENRLHYHIYNYEQNQSNQYEYNNPYETAYGEKLYFESRVPYNTIDVGGFFMNSVYNTRQSFWNPSMGGSVQDPNASYRNDYWYQRNLATFVQDDIKVRPNVDVTPGLRAINYQTSYFNDGAAQFPLAPTAHNQATLPSSQTAFTKVEPSLDINWQASQNLAFFANYAEAYRQPSDGGGGGPYQSILSSTLQLEQGKEYQVGLKWHSGQPGQAHHAVAGIDWYDLKYGNQIIGVSTALGTYLVSAFGSSDYRGLNLYATDNPTYHLHLFGNAGIERATFNSYATGSASYAGLPVSNVPQATLNAGAFYRWYANRTRFEPGLWYQYVGDQYLFSNLAGAPTNQKMGGYGLWNASFTATYHPQSSSDIKDVKLGVSVTNLLNREYNQFEYISSGSYFVAPASAGAVLAYPGAPRMVEVTLEVGF